MKLYIERISEHLGLSEKKMSKLLSSTEIKSYKKGTILQHKGEPTGKGYYVHKGILRSYIIDSKGKEHVFMFAPEDWIVGDIQAQAFDEPSQLYIDVIEDCEVEILKEEFFKELVGDIPHQFPGGVDKLLRRSAVLQKRVLSLLGDTAIERYIEFEKTYPNIIQRVPQRMIATYLGITPEALSKVRGQYLRGEI